MGLTNRYVQPHTAWVNATVYALDSMVIGSDGYSYFCKSAHTSETGVKGRPTDGTAWATYWTVCTGTSTYPWTWAQAMALGTAADACLIKAGSGGSYDNTSTASTPAGTPTVTSPLMIVGCDASWVPIVPSRATDGPLTDAAGHAASDASYWPQLTWTTVGFTNKAFTVVRCLHMTSAKNGGTYSDGAANAVISSCSVTNSGTGASADAILLSNNSSAMNCDCYLTGASGGRGAIYTTATSRIYRNRVTCSGNNTAPGIYIACATNLPIVVGNVIYAPAGHAISVTITSGSAWIEGNTCVDCTGTSHGVFFADGATGLNFVIGNQLTDNGGSGLLAFNDDIAIYSAFNRETRNTNADDGAQDWLDATSFGKVTTAQAGATAAIQRLAEYAAPSSQDYRLKTASYAKNAGIWPGLDIGAIQRTEPVPAAAALVVSGTTIDQGNVSNETAPGIFTGISVGAGLTYATGVYDGSSYHATTGLAVASVRTDAGSGDGIWYDGDSSHTGTLNMALYTLLTTVTSTLNTNKDEMIAANASLQAAYSCDAGTDPFGGGPLVGASALVSV